MKKSIISIIIILVIMLPFCSLAQGQARLNITRINIIPNKPKSNSCCFTIQVWVRNVGNTASEKSKFYVFVKGPQTGQTTSFQSMDHNTGNPLYVDTIYPNRESLIYNRADWIVTLPPRQTLTLIVEILGHDKREVNFTTQ